MGDLVGLFVTFRSVLVTAGCTIKKCKDSEQVEMSNVVADSLSLKES